MICPVISYRSELYEIVECKQEQCQWWVWTQYPVSGYNCAMPKIAQQLNEINQNYKDQ